jgi:hypothetical protein
MALSTSMPAPGHTARVIRLGSACIMHGKKVAIRDTGMADATITVELMT